MQIQDWLNQSLYWAEQDMRRGLSMPFPGLWASRAAMHLVENWSNTLAQEGILTHEQYERVKAVLAQCEVCLGMQPWRLE